MPTPSAALAGEERRVRLKQPHPASLRLPALPPAGARRVSDRRARNGPYRTRSTRRRTKTRPPLAARPVSSVRASAGTTIARVMAAALPGQEQRRAAETASGPRSASAKAAGLRSRAAAKQAKGRMPPASRNSTATATRVRRKAARRRRAVDPISARASHRKAATRTAARNRPSSRGRARSGRRRSIRCRPSPNSQRCATSSSPRSRLWRRAASASTNGCSSRGW